MDTHGWRRIASALIFLLGLLAIAPASAQTAMPSAPAAKFSSPTMTAEQCLALRSTGFGDVQDAPGDVLSTEVFAATDKLPAFCNVQGYVNPQVGFEFHLPMTGWNGKFVVEGCGGTCGDLSAIETCAHAVARGYACGTTDMGHHAVSTSVAWAYNNPLAEIDIGHRATHVTTLMGKAIVAAFYSSKPSKSYFLGCSTGGRQGLIEAQRYPFDFDGIVAGSAVTYTYTAPLQLFWTVTANLDASGNEIMGLPKLKFLAAKVMEACDKVDGLKDNVISDPRMCKYDIGVLGCSVSAMAAGGDTTACLTPKEMAVVRKYYAGPSNSKGPIGTDGAAPFGSEMMWAVAFMGQGRNSVMYKWAQDNLRYMAFAIDPGPSYKLADFDWDRDPQRLGYALLNGGNPDVRMFASHGGKLILYHGSNETALGRTIEYSNMVTAIAGGQEKAKAFLRTYLIPGFGHCAGPNGVNYFDQLTAIDNWADQGKAPDMIMGYNVTFTHRWDDRDQRFPGAGKAIGPMLAPAGFTGDNVAAMKANFVRPLFPFPDLAIYRAGDPNDPKSYRRVRGTDQVQ